MIYVNQMDYQVSVEVDTGTVSTRMMCIINPFQQLVAQQGAIVPYIAVHQARANRSVLEAFIQTICKSISETENVFSVLLKEPAHTIERGTLSSQYFSDDISVGIPLQLLSNRPDVQRKRMYVA